MTAPSKMTKAELRGVIERKDEALNLLETKHKETFCIDDPWCSYCEVFRFGKGAA